MLRSNRVTQANGVQRTTGGAWPSVYAQHYSYDRWGNRWINSAGTWGANIFNTVILPNSANNRLNGMTYDSAGNTTTDNITGGGARTYDADNRMSFEVDVVFYISRARQAEPESGSAGFAWRMADFAFPVFDRDAAKI